jgi:hypothetical protein
MEELKRKNRLLSDEVKRSKHQAEKPYEQQAGKDIAVVISCLYPSTHLCLPNVLILGYSRRKCSEMGRR